MSWSAFPCITICADFVATVFTAKVKPVEIALEERTKIATMTHQLVPLVKKVIEILPLFLAMTGNRDDVKKIITFVGRFTIRDLELDADSVTTRRPLCSMIKFD